MWHDESWLFFGDILQHSDDDPFYPKLVDHVYWFIYLLICWPCQVPCGILVPWPGVEPRPTAVKASSPNLWTTRELPKASFLKWRTHQKNSHLTLITTGKRIVLWDSLNIFKQHLSFDFILLELSSFFEGEELLPPLDVTWMSLQKESLREINSIIRLVRSSRGTIHSAKLFSRNCRWLLWEKAWASLSCHLRVLMALLGELDPYKLPSKQSLACLYIEVL